MADTDPILEACAVACHAAFRADRGSKLHPPEECPCRESSRSPRPNAVTPDEIGCAYPCLRCRNEAVWIDGEYHGCHACRPALRAWPDLTEAARQTFRAQARPAYEVMRGREEKLMAAIRTLTDALNGKEPR